MAKKIVAIHQPQYLPWIPYIDKVLRSEQFVFLDTVQFQKNGVQNRNKIKTQNGSLWLTVPICHSFGQSIRETEIADEKSLSRHWMTLHGSYRKGLFFEKIAPMISSVLNSHYRFLSDLNCMLTTKILGYLGYQGDLIKASELKVEGQGSELILNLCKTLGAGVYLAGSGGHDYMNLESFKENHIEVIFQEHSGVEYTQLYPEQGFVKDLSSIDLLFNKGPESRKIIEQGRIL